MSSRVPLEDQTQCFTTQEILGVIDHEREGDDLEVRMTQVMEVLEEMFTHEEAPDPEAQLAHAHDSSPNDTGASEDELEQRQEGKEDSSQDSGGVIWGSQEGTRDLSRYNEGVRESIFEPRNRETASRYRSAADDYVHYCQEEGRMSSMLEESTFCNYFHDRVNVTKRFGLGSIWNKYSAINNWVQRHHGVNLNTYRELRQMMTNWTARYLPKKSGTITGSQLRAMFARWRTRLLMMGGCHENRLYIIAATLLWFGMLRGKELFLIEIGNVHLDHVNRTIRVKITKGTKTRVRGFNFTVPTEFYDEYNEYLKECERIPPNGRFVRYWHKKDRYRKNTAGIALLRRLRCEIEDEFIELVGTLTNHLWRRSSATEMADNGANALQLKMAGRWNSIKTAEGYVADSLDREHDAMRMLDGKHAAIVRRTEEPDGVLEDEGCKKMVSLLKLGTFLTKYSRYSNSRSAIVTTATTPTPPQNSLSPLKIMSRLRKK